MEDKLMEMYKGFNVKELSKIKVVKLFDMKSNSSNYYTVNLLHKVKPFELSLVSVDGSIRTYTADDFFNNSGEFAPYPRYSIEAIL